MLKILGLCAIVFVGVQTHAAAQEPVDLHEMDKIDWSELPEKAQAQIRDELDELAIDPDKEEDIHCYGSARNFACQFGDVWCTCFTVDGHYECGCEEPD